MESEHKSFTWTVVVGTLVLGAVLGGFTTCAIRMGDYDRQEYTACIQAGNEPLACRGKVVIQRVDR